ncbi:MAG: exodeoxyribonuclease V subunit gamma, partial [Nitriliruptoraceae bacterium]|nr:exodeoxyribonuclease V subunit gamma [Nitriliruptoraceae bacterium]
VLRDVLLHRFAQDPTLEPRDVVVLCPDLDAIAPLIEAVFTRPTSTADPSTPSDTAAGELRAGHLRVRIADRSLAAQDPTAVLALRLLGLEDARLGVSEVLDLLAREPVRARFGFTDEDLDRIAGWVEPLGIRWGLDAEHRTQFGLDTDEGTWAAGLARLLVGVTTSDEDRRTVLGVVPYDDVADGDVDLVGRLTECIVRLRDARRSLSGARELTTWVTALSDALDALADHREAPWQRLALDRVLDEIREDAEAAGVDVPLHAAEVVGLLTARLASRGGRADQRTGDLTVCDLVPMRSVPHRLVCLVGMDDGAFPRRSRLDGDDLLDHDERVGDRDPRSEDRQLLLDAVLAAGDAVIVTTTGADERTGDPRPPAVPIGELLDVLDRTAVTADGVPAGTARTVTHRLHASDPDNFRPGALDGWDGIRGADPGDVAGARALLAPRAAATMPFGDPLERVEVVSATAPVEEPDAWLGASDRSLTIELDRLHEALLRPVPSYLDARAGLRFPRRQATQTDELAVELGGLDAYHVGRALLEDRLEGAALDRALELVRGRGGLPPGMLAGSGLDEVTTVLQRLLQAAEDLGIATEPEPPRELVVDLPDAVRVVGTVDGLVGTCVRRLQYQRLTPPHRLRSWLAVLALTAATPDRDWHAVTIGRIPEKRKERRVRDPATIQVATARPPDLSPDERRTWATAELLRLIGLARTALRRPLPLLERTSAALAQARANVRVGASTASWTGPGANAFDDSAFAPVTGESLAPAIRLAFGPDRDFAALLDVAAVPSDPPVPVFARSDDGVTAALPELDTEVAPGPDGARLTRLAEVLWRPMLDHERRDDR